MGVERERHSDNDDRVICRMDVEGMPQQGLTSIFRRSPSKQATAWPASHPGQLTRSESSLYTWYSILAGLFVVFVFSVTLVMFILFCTDIWFP